VTVLGIAALSVVVRCGDDDDDDDRKRSKAIATAHIQEAMAPDARHRDQPASGRDGVRLSSNGADHGASAHSGLDAPSGPAG
jgi:hypothetical protein